MGSEEKIDVNQPEYYVNRELSWLEFNNRVLEEARDKEVLLFERMKFLSITASNLDEFFMVRVASLKDMVHAGYEKRDIAGMTPKEQLAAISAKTHELVNHQYSTLSRSIKPALKKEKLILLDGHEDMTGKQAEYADRYFMDYVYPVLTPMAVDSSRPFPLIRNKSLNLGALLIKKDTVKELMQETKEENEKNKKNGKASSKSSGKTEKKLEKELEFATVQMPSGIPRLILLPSEKEGEKPVILLEELIERNIHKLFLNYEVICAHPYRIMRNADLTIEEDEAEDLLKEIEKQIKKRPWGEAIRLEVEEHIDKRLLKILRKELDMKEEDIYYINGPLDLTFLMKLYGTEGYAHLRTAKFVPQPIKELSTEEDIFTQIRRGDILLHHPYQTFEPVVSFIRQAAKDPDVLAIKQTLYRVSGNSPIIASLAEAAENGKQVSVLVELKARFDEENNIIWAKKLEKAGCHVIYGLLGLKTHSKITLVVRSEEDGIRRYVHLGTGNYNDATAKLYTDLGLFTCSRAIGEDATAVFNMLSGYSEPLGWNKLSLAPLWLREKFLNLIERERKHAKEGREAFIEAKMNSLCDKEIIAALYTAAQAGVKIRLLVRGICCLRPEIPGVSETIEVHSIVGNYLEHARIFRFCNNGEEEIYLGSADWMPRNLDRRVEILFPIEEEKLKEKVRHILQVQFADTENKHIMKMDGSYEAIDRRGKVKIDAQKQFCIEAQKEIQIEEKSVENRVFYPLENKQ